MLAYLAKRLGLILPTAFGITLVSFGFIRILPGDPVLLMAGERGLSDERYNALLKQFGYDQPLWQQYYHYVINLLSGDFGTSIVTKKPVLTEFLTLFPATLELSICAMLFAILLGIPAGACGMLGAFLGSRLTIKKGGKLIRGMMFAVLALLLLKILYDLVFPAA